MHLSYGTTTSAHQPPVGASEATTRRQWFVLSLAITLAAVSRGSVFGLPPSSSQETTNSTPATTTQTSVGLGKPTCDKAFADAMTQYVLTLYKNRDDKNESRVAFLEAAVKFARDAGVDHDSSARIIEETLAFASDHRTAEVLLPRFLSMYLKDGLGLSPAEILVAALPWITNSDEFTSGAALDMIEGSGAFSADLGYPGYPTLSVIQGLFQSMPDEQQQKLSPLFWQALFDFEPRLAYETCVTAQTRTNPNKHGQVQTSFVNWIDLAQSQRSFIDYTPGVDPPPDSLAMAMLRGLAISDDWAAKLFALSVMDQKPCFEDARTILKLLKDPSPAVAGVARLLQNKINVREREKQFEQPNEDPKMRDTQWALISYDGPLSRVSWDGAAEVRFWQQCGSVEALSAGTVTTVKLASPFRVPRSIDVQWTRVGEFVHQVLPLTDSIQEQDHFHGTVWLLYTKGHWEAQMLTKDQSADLLQRTGSAVPKPSPVSSTQPSTAR